jgi:spermidine/putrescine transport system permease protein
MTIAVQPALRPPRSQSAWAQAWPVYPLVLLLLAIFVYPVGQILVLSLFDTTRQPTAANYVRIVTTPVYLQTLVITFEIAGWTTALALLAGYPVAYLLAHASARARDTLTLFVLMPFWTSFLVRTFAMIFLLRDSGLVNTVLLRLGLIEAPLTLLYTPFAVLLGLVYGFLPFMILPIYASLEKLDPTLLEAAETLGATPMARFRRITLPLSLPGVVAGCFLVFIPAMGSFLTSDLLGGAKELMIGNLIQNQFAAARNWPFGSAASFVVTALVLVAVAAYLRVRDRAADQAG